MHVLMLIWKQIKQFKEELLRAMKPYAYHVNSISGLSELKASVQKENMYRNEVVDGAAFSKRL